MCGFVGFHQVDELGGNNLESTALIAVGNAYEPSQFQSADDYNDLSKSQKEVKNYLQIYTLPAHSEIHSIFNLQHVYVCSFVRS